MRRLIVLDWSRGQCRDRDVRIEPKDGDMQLELTRDKLTPPNLGCRFLYVLRERRQPLAIEKPTE